ncbi:MAG: hypothetical protein VKJ25_08575 [Okeania sp.]|nr:hypothetical protein [Okeania sp.]
MLRSKTHPTRLIESSAAIACSEDIFPIAIPFLDKSKFKIQK